MKPEEFEVYVIPPNFMEGGTLFGGLLKTRNRKTQNFSAKLKNTQNRASSPLW